MEAVNSFTTTKRLNEEEAPSSRNRARVSRRLECPTDFILSTARAFGLDPETEQKKAIDEFLDQPQEDDSTSLDPAVVRAVRFNGLPALKLLILRPPTGEEKETSWNNRNQFGESLLHIACRCDHLPIVEFLLNDAKLSLRVRDLQGRTPLHNACWTVLPNYELLQLLIEEAPTHLFVKDARGNTPFRYIPKAQWEKCVAFLSNTLSF